MTVLTGGSQYIYRGEELPDKNPVEKHSESRSDIEHRVLLPAYLVIVEVVL